MKTLSLILATAVIGGLVFAQQRGPGPRGKMPARAGVGPGMGFGGGLDGGLLNGPNVEQRLTRALSLSAEQQNQLHTALEEQKVTTKGLAEKTQDLRKQLTAAIQAGDEGKIDQVTRDLSQVTQQRTAISAKTMAKVYKSLDASQKGTIDRVFNRQMGVRPLRPSTADKKQ